MPGEGRWVTGAYGMSQSLPLRSINAFFATLYSAAKGVLYYSIIVPGSFHKHPRVVLGLELPVDEQVPGGLEPQTAQEK